jgi:hypothetical protein
MSDTPATATKACMRLIRALLPQGDPVAIALMQSYRDSTGRLGPAELLVLEARAARARKNREQIVLQGN